VIIQILKHFPETLQLK